MRLTYRTVRVLMVIAGHAGASNREIAQGSGIVDQGQISKLLARLERLGSGGEPRRGPGEGSGERMAADSARHAPGASHAPPLSPPEGLHARPAGPPACDPPAGGAQLPTHSSRSTLTVGGEGGASLPHVADAGSARRACRPCVDRVVRCGRTRARCCEEPRPAAPPPSSRVPRHTPKPLHSSRWRAIEQTSRAPPEKAGRRTGGGRFRAKFAFWRATAIELSETPFGGSRTVARRRAASVSVA